MTENEAIEELKSNCNELGKAIPCDTGLGMAVNEAYGMAIKSLEEIQQYRAIGTIAECREARKRQNIEEDADPVRQIVSIPSTDETFKSALRRATTPQIHEALKRMERESGKRARISACMGELRKRRREQEKVLAAYKAIQNYCNNREKCDGCLFEMEEGIPGTCIMEFQDVPAEWQELELD